MPAVPCCTTGRETRVPRGNRRGLRRSARHRSACRQKHGIADQTEDREQRCRFQTRELVSKHRRVLPAKGSLKRKPGARLKRRLTRGLIKTGAAPPEEHSFVNKLATEEGVLSNLPRGSADGSVPRLFVSVLDFSSLEEATNNFSFQEFPLAPCPDQHIDGIEGPADKEDRDGGHHRGSGESPEAIRESFLEVPTAPDQPLASASAEWQQRLEAAEALLILKGSSQAPSGSISPLQP